MTDTCNVRLSLLFLTGRTEQLCRILSCFSNLTRIENFPFDFATDQTAAVVASIGIDLFLLSTIFEEDYHIIDILFLRSFGAGAFSRPTVVARLLQ